MPTLVDDLLDFVTHPAVAPHLANMLVSYTAPTRDFQAEMSTKLDEISSQLASKKRGRKPKAAPVTGGTDAGSSGAAITSLADVRDHTVKLAATLKEAARFARSNPDHPDAIQRLNDARRMADELTEAERYVLAPERVPADQKPAVEAVLPLIRTTRELTLNSLTSVEGIADAAAAAGNAATALQVAVATGAVPALPKTDDSLYGRAAKTESGCVECGRAHLAAVAATLRRAAKDAQAKGWADQDVQSRLAFAQEELAALAAYDWTPEKIARNPHTEQEVLRGYVPQVDELHNQLRSVTDPDSLARLAEQATQLREGFETALPQKFQMITITGRKSDAGVDLSKLELFGLPTSSQVREITAPDTSRRYFEELREKLRLRGVKVVYRQPQYESPGIIIEGEYNPATNQVNLNPAAMDVEDPYHLQVLIHEGVHSLLHNKQCLPVSVITPDVRARAEEETELTVIAAMTELGMPIEDREGNVVVPAKRGVDWELLRSNVDPEVYEDVRAATEWVVAAAQGADGDLSAWTCPALRSVTVQGKTEFVTPVQVKFGTIFHLTNNQKRRMAGMALDAYRKFPGARTQQYQVGEYVVRVAPVAGGIGVGIVDAKGEYERVLTVPQGDESLAEPSDESFAEPEPDDSGDFERATRTTPRKPNEGKLPVSTFKRLHENKYAIIVSQSDRGPIIGYLPADEVEPTEVVLKQGVMTEQEAYYWARREAEKWETPLFDPDNDIIYSERPQWPPTLKRKFQRVIVCPPIEGGDKHG